MKRYIVPLLMLCLVALTASAQKSKDHNFEVGKHLDIFNQVYKNLELLYVDTLNPKETTRRRPSARVSMLCSEVWIPIPSIMHRTKPRTCG